jgi:hypothetical protein
MDIRENCGDSRVEDGGRIFPEMGNGDEMRNILDGGRRSGKVSSGQFTPRCHPNFEIFLKIFSLFTLLFFLNIFYKKLN